MEQLLTAKELAAWLNVPGQTVYLWVSQRKIPHLKIGKCVRFDREEIRRWLGARRVKASPSARLVRLDHTAAARQTRTKKFAPNC